MCYGYSIRAEEHVTKVEKSSQQNTEKSENSSDDDSDEKPQRRISFKKPIPTPIKKEDSSDSDSDEHTDSQSDTDKDETENDGQEPAFSETPISEPEQEPVVDQIILPTIDMTIPKQDMIQAVLNVHYLHQTAKQLRILTVSANSAFQQIVLDIKEIYSKGLGQDEEEVFGDSDANDTIIERFNETDEIRKVIERIGQYT
jgi:hypothetical protein